jgi:intracellular septation protein A
VNAQTPLSSLLVRAGGIRGLIYTSLPVTAFGAANVVVSLQWALGIALGIAAVIMGWQLVRRESVRPALFGFAAVAVGAGAAFVTGRAKDFYLPGIVTYVLLGTLFTVSVLIRRPLIGVGWAWITGRDDSWRRVRRVRRAFDLVTVMMAVASWARFGVQYYLYETDQAELLAAARVVMGWPIWIVTSTLIYLAIRTAIRALPRSAEAG